MLFSEGSVSYSELPVEARKIATSRLCNDKEAFFFAKYTNKVGNHYDQEIGRSNCTNKVGNHYVQALEAAAEQAIEALGTDV